MASVPRSDAILAKLAMRTGITRCGEEWLKEALDPFHDTMLDPTGYPDTTSSASVIQPIKQSFQIAAPSGTVANWDCNVIMMPWLNQVQFPTSGTTSTANTNVLVQSNSANTVNIGGIQIVSGEPGAPLSPVQILNTSTRSNTSNVIPSTYLNANSRVVAMAMEIVNTTSDLNRQGLVTVYRVPVPQNDDATVMNIKSFNTGDTNSFTGAAGVLFMPAPPNSIAAAQLFAGTKAWKAADGSYNVAQFNTPDVPAQGLSYTSPVLYTTSQTDATVFAPTFARFVFQQVGIDGIATVPSTFWTEFEMSGSYFTGLSLSTTLTVNYIVYIERFPTQDDLDLIVSAKRSPEYDIRALEAYSIIAQSLPVAVPFAENGLGDWFRGAVNLAADVLPAIPNPWAQGIGMAANAVKGVWDSFDQPPSDTSAPQAPPIEMRKYVIKPGRKAAGNVSTKQLTKGRQKLKKTVRKEVRKDLQADIRAARGRPQKRKRKAFTI